jgi:demethylmenaquinone methyltransferase/2-methoxy-6-polyprenyl-1,4-benzoquinol methylase
MLSGDTLVKSVFDKIVNRYDLLNDILSLRLIRQWRSRLAKICPANSLVLDICTGSGEMANTIRKYTSSKVVAVDFLQSMIKLAQKRHKNRLLLLVGDVLRLPFKSRIFDACCVVFGLRNLCDVKKGFEEVYRVLKPDRNFYIIETDIPTDKIICQLYLFYVRYLMPLIGRFFTGTTSYYYLSKTIQQFARDCRIEDELKKTGFKDIKSKPLSLGVVRLFQGKK